MNGDATAPRDTPTLADGWDEEDVAMLKELARYGMALAGSLTRQVLAHEAACDKGEAQPVSRVEAAKVALDFSRITRAVRLSLALKARALGAEVKARAPDRDVAPNFGPTDDWDDQVAAQSAAIRMQLEHAIDDPNRPLSEIERLRESLELRLESEAEEENFLRFTPEQAIERICRDLGLPCSWRASMDENQVFHSWIVARAGDPKGPLIWPGEGPQDADFMARWMPDPSATAPSLEDSRPGPPPADAPDDRRPP